jgi:hypothetical protein
LRDKRGSNKFLFQRLGIWFFVLFPQSADVYAGAICGYLKMGNSQDHGMFWTDPHCIGNFHLNYSPNYSVRAEPHSLIGSCQPGSTWCLIIQTALLWCMVPPCMEFLPRLQPPLLGPAQEPNPVKGVIGPSRSAHQIISQRTAIPRQRLVAQGKHQRLVTAMMRQRSVASLWCRVTSRYFRSWQTSRKALCPLL